MGGGHTEGAAARRQSERGSILLETVVAIPLYMVLLGGVMWLGDLLVTRQQLVIADRYVAWNKGLRYADAGKLDAGTLHRRLFAGSDGVPRAEYTLKAGDGKIEQVWDWSHRASGQARLSMRMPIWTSGFFSVGDVMHETGMPDQFVADLWGRDKPGERHAVLMRTKEEAKPGFIRNKYRVPGSAEVAKKWRDIAAEKWPYE